MKCENCSFEREAAFNVCPKCGWVRPEAQERLDSERDLMGNSSSRVAYLGVEMMMFKNPGDALGHLMYQVAELKGKGMKAWFVDIIYKPEQMGEALWVSREIKNQLDQLMPWQKHGKQAITVHINPFFGKFTQYKAETEMKKIIADHRKAGLAKNVNYKTQDGKKLPIEY